MKAVGEKRGGVPTKYTKGGGTENGVGPTERMEHTEEFGE